MTEHAMDNDLIRDHEENVKLHNQEHSNFPSALGHKHSYKTAVSTLYGDVDPTPTTGESSNNGSQSNRNNSPDEEPGGPGPSPSKAPAAAGELEGGAGLASELGEAASLAVLASKYRKLLSLSTFVIMQKLENGRYGLKKLAKRLVLMLVNPKQSQPSALWKVTFTANGTNY
jgi:hypothetical protein